MTTNNSSNTADSVTGSIGEIISNPYFAYEGNLAHYFNAFVYTNKGITNPYHNFSHTGYVLWRIYKAIQYYIHNPTDESKAMTKTNWRALLIGALLHDVDHSGKLGSDEDNIEKSIKFFERFILKQDVDISDEVKKIIRATCFPYKQHDTKLTFSEKLIRDADMSQSLSPVWLNQVVIGLAREWDQDILEILIKQIDWHTKLSFYTDYGKSIYTSEHRSSKLAEINSIIHQLKQGLDRDNMVNKDLEIDLNSLNKRLRNVNSIVL